jgi:hypothetical protein
MGVEETVVHTETRGGVAGVHGVGDVATDTDAPVEVLTPESGVGATNIGYGSAVVLLAEKGFAKTGALVELVGEAAVANHKGGFTIVLHSTGVGVGEGRLVPAIPIAMGGIVDPAEALVIKITEC